MASVLGQNALTLFGLVMMVVGGMIALLMIVWEMIAHPFTVFKKIPRNGESPAEPGNVLKKIITVFISLLLWLTL